MTDPIKVRTQHEDRGAARGIDRISDRARRMGSATLRAGRVAATGLAVIGAAGLAAAGKLAQGAAEDQQSATRMATTFRNSAGATKAQIAATESWISKVGEAKGVADDQLRPALSNIVTATKDVGQAQKLTSLAMDVAAARGVSLEAVSKSIAKAQNGQTAGLARLGINTKNAAGKTIDMETATKRLGDAYGGAAAANAGTLMGRIERLKLMFSEAGESIGYKMLPPLLNFSEWALEKGVPAVTRIASTLAGSLAPPLRTVGGFAVDLVAKVRDLAAGFDSGSSALAPIVAALQTYAATAQNVVLPAIAAVAGYLASRLVPVFVQVGGIIATHVVPIVARFAQFVYGQLIPAVVAIAARIATNLRPILDQLVVTFQARVLPAVTKVLAKFAQWQPTIQRVVTVVVKVVGKVLEFAAAILGKVLPILIRFSGFLTGTTISALVAVVGAVVKVIGKVGAFGGAVVGAVKKVAEFQRGVSERVAKVVGYFIALPGRITGAFGNAAGMLLQTGVDLIAGLLQGIRSKAGEIAGTIKSYVIDKIPGPIRKAMGIESPSKVLRKIGRQIMDGLIAGIRGGSSGLSDALSKTTDLVTRVFEIRLSAVEKNLRKRLDGKALEKALARAEAASAKARKATLAGLRAESAAVAKVVRAREVLQSGNYLATLTSGSALRAQMAKLEVKNLDEARQKLADLRQQLADYAASVKASVIATGNITGLGQNEDGTVSSAGMVDDLRDKLARSERFAALIQQLTGKLNATSLQQLVDQGVDGGLAAAEALAAGGAGTIAQINDLTAKLAKTGESLGASTAKTFYGVGVNAAEGVVKGLEAQAKNLDRAAVRLANALVKAVKKALGIKSPSTKFRGIATNVVQGLDFQPHLTHVRRQGAQLANSLTDGFGTPALEAYRNVKASAAAGANAPQVIEIHLTADALDEVSAGRRYIAAIDTAVGQGGARTKHIVINRSNA